MDMPVPEVPNAGSVVSRSSITYRFSAEDAPEMEGLPPRPPGTAPVARKVRALNVRPVGRSTMVSCDRLAPTVVEVTSTTGASEVTTTSSVKAERRVTSRVMVWATPILMFSCSTRWKLGSEKTAL